MCEAIMSLYKTNSFTMIHSKRIQTNLHWILQAIGSSMAIAGMFVEFFGRQAEEKHHFVSNHSKIGNEIL